MALQTIRDAGRGVTLSYFRVDSICTYFTKDGERTSIRYGAYVSKDVRETDLDNWFWQAGFDVAGQPVADANGDPRAWAYEQMKARDEFKDATDV